MRTRRLTADDVRDRIRARALLAGGMRALAREWRVSHAYISDVLRGGKDPGAALLLPLGLEAETTYQRITQTDTAKLPP